MKLSRAFQETLDAIKSTPGGCTDQQLAEAMGLSVSTVNWRRLRLQRMGLVTPCGVRDTGAKIKQTIWRATNG